jgi:membrane protein YqaA with SNARE-associated domain
LLRIIAFSWGLLEATIFFFVPDVYLTGVVLKGDFKKILTVFFYSLFGALLGGIVVYYFAFSHPVKIWAWLDYIPGISEKLIQNVRMNISLEGPLSMFKGMFRGVPYKLFAAAWGEQKGNLSFFLLISFVARGIRFIASMLAAAFLRTLGAKFIQNWNIWRWVIYCIFWIAFYSLYFQYYRW